MLPDGAGGFYFDFPQAGHVNYVTTTPAGTLSAISLSYVISALTGAPPAFLEVDCGTPGCTPGPGLMRLYVQRCGDDWGGDATGKASFRFWSAPTPLILGGTIVYRPITGWTNVDGQQDAAALQVTLANACSVGFTFGGMFAGHGVISSAPARFTLKAFSTQQ
jgi:hypothetical protein